MGSRGTIDGMAVDGAECSETTVEIKIKTLDSQTYTLRVNKRMPVPELKERIATVTGVVSAQQRLICRGRVLKDDQLLSAYHVEDGHTLHLVVRQPQPHSSASTENSMGSGSLPAQAGNQVPRSVVLGTFNIGEHGDGGMPDLNQMVTAVLSSIGITNIGGASEGMNPMESGAVRFGRTSVAGNVEPQQPSPARSQFDTLFGASHLPTAASLGLHPPVIPDSLTTLSQYLIHLRNEFSVNGQSSNGCTSSPHISEGQEQSGSDSRPAGRPGLPSPESLAEVMRSTRELLIEQAGVCLSGIARQLEDQVNVTNSSVRNGIQTNAMATGVLLQNLGAMLLELGRTTMTLRMGQTASEAVVNTGPAVFISSSGPNPIMVQPLPFQPRMGFGTIPARAVNSGPSVVGGTLGAGLLPRNIDIRILTGTSMNTQNVDLNEPASSQQTTAGIDISRSSDRANFVQRVTSSVPGQSFNIESGVRMLPVRTVLAAIPSVHASVAQPQHIAPDFVEGARVRDGSTTTTSDPTVTPPFSASGPSTTIPQHAGQAEQEETRSADMQEAAPSLGINEGIFFSQVVHQLMPYISQVTGTEPNVASQTGEDVSQHRTSQDSSARTEENIIGIGTSHERSDPSPPSPSSKRQKRE